MCIITISRGTFSGGTQIAECLAKRLGYECISREVLTDAAKDYGVSTEMLAAAVEKAPTFLERLGRHRDAYLAFFRAAFCERALRGNLVYHGHAGHFLLPGIHHVIRVRVVAPLEFRIVEAMRRMSFSRPDAIAYIEKVDRDRVRWTQFLYNVAWNDPCHYDMVINLEKMSVPTACAIVAQLTEQEDFAQTPESERALRNLALRSRVQAALCADPRTADAHVDVMADDGDVTVQGWARLQQGVDAIRDVAVGVEGVAQLRCEVVVRSGFPI